MVNCVYSTCFTRYYQVPQAYHQVSWQAHRNRSSIRPQDLFTFVNNEPAAQLLVMLCMLLLLLVMCQQVAAVQLLLAAAPSSCFIIILLLHAGGVQWLGLLRFCRWFAATTAPREPAIQLQVPISETRLGQLTVEKTGKNSREEIILFSSARIHILILKTSP